jgi:dTDP-4-dehydrorhamnose 3,5-epimerase
MWPGSKILDIIPYEDSRGSLKKILMQSQLKAGHIEEVYLIYTGKGSVRGNHYHKFTLEYFTVVSGRAVIVLKDLSTGAVQELRISAHDNKIIMVPPGVAHAFKNEREEPLVILAVSTREYDKEDPDTYAIHIT